MPVILTTVTMSTGFVSACNTPATAREPKATMAAAQLVFLSMMSPYPLIGCSFFQEGTGSTLRCRAVKKSEIVQIDACRSEEAQQQHPPGAIAEEIRDIEQVE